ncbi:D-alanine--D-alanine ligase [Pelagibius litoralis]|uniref:D-alanine--D-alanine ligase n=1 Tax=Pelagibius litoralis TaxID=374515 RepID=A0A967EWV9_9PROT|nr:D-alanine--D-alanine ligase [Pelagibius litoralis]NIA68628.1 D-alanine--D-alanine ligase [Pelagibius litoralis]
MSKSVAVLMGGVSAEREVSLNSGAACATALREANYRVSEIDVSRDMAALVAALEPAPDAIFNALHGRWGEDGCVQGLLELLQIPYTHSGVLASALAMDKVMAKSVVAAAGVASPTGLIVKAKELDRGDPMPRPYVVKPPREGSSVGVRIVREGDNQPPIAVIGWQPDQDLLVEPFVPGRELTVSVMGDRALAVTEIKPLGDGFYDYDAKYSDDSQVAAVHVIPAEVPESIYTQALDASLAAHKALGCRGVSRSDFRYDDTVKQPGELYYLETNTQPGMTSNSLVPEQARHAGLSLSELCAWMVENAACDS